MTTTATTSPKTIAELLAEGQRILAENERQENERREQEEEIRLGRWLMLVDRTRKDLGELADDLPEDPPEDFFVGHYQYTFCFRPFDAAWMNVYYWYSQEENRWLPRSKFVDQNNFLVGIAFQPEFDDAEDGFWPRMISAHGTNNLAEAIAVCEVAGADYRKCEEECRRREEEAKTRKQNPETREPVMQLSRAERSLILAFRAMIDERQSD